MKNKSSIARVVVPLVVGLIALGIVVAMMQGTPRNRPTEGTNAETALPAATVVAMEAAQAGDAAPAVTATEPSPSASVVSAGQLAARAPSGTGPLTSLGSLDPAHARMRVDFTPGAAGISQIVFSEYWNTAEESRAAKAHALDSSKPLPPDSARYTLRPEGFLPRAAGSVDTTPELVPMLAVHSIMIDGVRAELFGAVWSETSPGTFVTEIVRGDVVGESVSAPSPVARVTRTITFAGEGFDLLVTHRVENLTAAPIQSQLWMYGPGDLALEANGLLDVRRFQFGYLLPKERDPSQATVVSNDGMIERSTVASMVEESGSAILWPAQDRAGESLSWFGSTNRYFAFAIHAPFTEGVGAGVPGASGKSLADTVATVYGQQGVGVAPAMFSIMAMSPREVAPGTAADLDFAAYAGPLSRSVLIDDEPYGALGMVGLIVYQMSGCCSWCTFAWLADGLVVFLGMLHNHVFFDWGLAIIALVVVVRLALHPLTRKSQIQMQKVGRVMSALKPELEELQKRYKDEPKRMQQEQMRLYSEYGVNPLGCLGGFLPMFLQMPIWIALYAVLYLAFELRQEAAFFGIFQMFGGWLFLGDLSEPDNFFTFGRSFDLWLFSLQGVNVVPLLMGAVFFIQQKYMQPPSMTTLTPEQEQQQKMMKWMTVILFPVMLYKAPSGLTLYIMTSTIIGIWESKRVRAEVAKMDITPKKRAAVKPKDEAGRRYADALDRLQSRNDKKTFKDRE
ncbi:MAG: YidC/Oxa1 family insertase periplasmic-domain containing protein [Planctomycetota bacterium]|nr:YidC/Oxa1 family insertase periplasmic-domain containing protein [Planctomycetota bacterium]MDA1105346.1 YidC/Oxa1 family insertase periplasmic-domain containing protein [Planctomycetota bacterium]